MCQLNRFIVGYASYFRVAADVVIKAQVVAGGRGLGTFTNGFHGGVHMATRAKQAYDLASKMLGQKLITKQTGEGGRRVDKVRSRRNIFYPLAMLRSITGSKACRFL
jgi:hypothetical protein